MALPPGNPSVGLVELAIQTLCTTRLDWGGSLIGMTQRTEKPTSTHQVKLYDPQTGELLDARGEIDLPKRRAKLRRGRARTFAMLDLERIHQLRLSGVEWQILMQLLATMNRETGQSRMQVREIGAELGMHESSVSRSLGNLIKRRIVFKEGQGIYRISAHLAFRGAGDEWDTAEHLQSAPELFL